MKLTNAQLKQIIQEELRSVLHEWNPFGGVTNIPADVVNNPNLSMAPEAAEMKEFFETDDGKKLHKTWREASYLRNTDRKEEAIEEMENVIFLIGSLKGEDFAKRARKWMENWRAPTSSTDEFLQWSDDMHR